MKPGGATTGRDAAGALQGLKVVDLSRVFAGPLCTQMLADNGADVIKVEPPAGDETRTLGPPFDDAGDAAYYRGLNRGKRAISLNLSTEGGRRVLLRLLEDADVLVENFLPGTMENWGLGYEDVLSARFPGLVYCAISGFGRDGPLGGLPGYDAVLQAMCGLMSVNGDPASGATRVGVPVVDHLTAYVAMTAILMALHARSRTGRGQRVEATLFDTGLSLLLPQAINWLASGIVPGLLGSAHPNIAPYDKFAVRDGEIFVGIVNDAQFRRFCRRIGQPDLADDPRFASNRDRVRNRDALRGEIEAALRDCSAAALCEELMRVGVPAGAVNAVPEALAHPQALHRDILVRDGDYAGIRSPARLHGTPGALGRRPPRFAQDTQGILREHGIGEEEVEKLVAQGAVLLRRTLRVSR